MSNPGVYPLVPTSDVGKVRLIIGDTISVPFDPVVSGQQDYTLFGDDEITAFLSYSESPMRAAGYAYLSLAGAAAQQAESIKDYDLAVDSRQKAENLRAQAAFYFEQADKIEAAGESGFQIVSTGRRLTRAELAELDWSEVDYTDWIV
jgi:hypothetical protein